MLVKFLHPLKAELPMTFTLPGMLTLIKLLHP